MRRTIRPIAKTPKITATIVSVIIHLRRLHHDPTFQHAKLINIGHMPSSTRLESIGARDGLSYLWVGRRPMENSKPHLAEKALSVECALSNWYSPRVAALF